MQPRWKELLKHYEQALGRLSKIVDLKRERQLNEFEEDSVIKRFEFTYEMAWKLMMSYEKSNGVLQLMGSKDVVRNAISMSLIENGEAWMDMSDARNRTSHLYDEGMAKDVIDAIVNDYYPLLQDLLRKMETLSCTD